MPKGFANPKLRDARNFSLDEWQQAKRAGLDPRELNPPCKNAGNNRTVRLHSYLALEERGLFLARGDRRGFVAVTIDGDVFAVARMIDAKSKDVASRLGDPAKLRSVDETKQFIGEQIAPRLTRYIGEAKRIAHLNMQPLVASAKRSGFSIRLNAKPSIPNSKPAGTKSNAFAHHVCAKALPVHGTS